MFYRLFATFTKYFLPVTLIYFVTYLYLSICLLNAEVDTASAERESHRSKEAASDTASLPSYIYVDRPVFATAASDVPDLGDGWIRVVEARRRSAGTTARHHRETRRADCRRQNEDFTTSAAAAGHSYYPTVVSAMEPGTRRTHHLAAKKSPQPLDCEGISVAFQTNAAAVRSSCLQRSSSSS